jgi:hypothetical protein
LAQMPTDKSCTAQDKNLLHGTFRRGPQPGV